jgi:putative membrane protein
MKLKNMPLLLIFATGLVVYDPSDGRTASHNPRSGMACADRKMMDPEDSEFIIKGIQAARTEVTEAYVATQRSRRAGLRDTARGILRDHERANTHLVALAKGKGLTLPEVHSAPTNVGYHSDARVIAALLMSNEEEVASFYRETVRGKDPEFQQFAEATLPTLQRHLSELRSLQSSVPPNA